MRLLISGGCGFIGTNFVNHIVPYNYKPLHSAGLDKVVVLDALTYAGNRQNIAGLDCELEVGDIADAARVSQVVRKHWIDTIIHFAAESHVDRSIVDGSSFLRTNVQGTLNLLNVARDCSIKKFLHVSTDEVYGSIRHTLIPTNYQP